jgi:hypothetical protein
LHAEGQRDRQQGQALTGAARRTAVAIGATVVLAFAGSGCGGETSAVTAAGAAPQIAIRIAIVSPARAHPRTSIWHLRCGPVGGNWPNAVSACAALAPWDLRPIGPETRDLVPITRRPLRLTGMAFGDPVSLYFPVRGSSTRRLRFEPISGALGLDDVPHHVPNAMK